MRTRKTVVLLTIFMCGAAIFWGILYPDKANSGPYLNSMHGDTAYGVDRTSLSSFGYSKGNCAHCHEQHAMIGGSEPEPQGGPERYLLLERNFNTSKTSNPYNTPHHDDVCFYCHIGTGTYQQPPAFSNYSYSYTFGGCSAIDCPTANIFEAFNSLSYHNLYDVWRFITGKSGIKTFITNFPEWSNPCSGCHNVHIAQKSCGKPSGSFDAAKAAISKPSGHGNLWGDSADEKMSHNYAGSYQAPYYKSDTTYEPDGSNTSDPSILPDYVAFCTDCHNANSTINSTSLGRPLHTINWDSEMHGAHRADYCTAPEHTDPPTVPPILKSLLADPYDGLNKCGDYVLACTDCHEPHGSPNNFLVRKQVNKGIVDVKSNGTGYADGRENKEWVNLCGKCHTGLLWGDLLLPHHDANTGLTCTVCHGDALGSSYKPCSDCHKHGNKNIPGYGDWSNPLF